MDNDKRYALIRVHVPNHIVIILWDLSTNIMELFNSSGNINSMRTVEDDIKRIFNGVVISPQGYLIFDEWFIESGYDKSSLPDTYYIPKKRYNLPDDPLIIEVNDTQLQTSPGDKYCQTWIYYYIFMRLRWKFSYRKIMEHLYNLTPEQRLETIEEFWEFILKQ